MKKTKSKNTSEQETAKNGRPTLLEFLASVHSEYNRQFGMESEIDSDLRTRPLPDWGKETVTRLGKTIFRPILKLRPRKKVTCQHFGQLVGILGRGITFYRKDAMQAIHAEGLDKISDEKWETIQPSDQLRACLVKRLGRAVADAESVEDLAAELIEKRLKGWEEMRTHAFRLMAGRSAKDNAMFLKGVAQGYGMLIDADGEFSGDRGRTEIYLELLSSMHEIQKMRRVLPERNVSHLYEHLKPWYKFPEPKEKGRQWLQDVCDDICLYIKGGPGRPYQFRKQQEEA